MSEERQNEFYKIVRKEGFSEVYKGDDIIATIDCEELVQCDTALVAKEKNGPYSIYLPILVDADRWNLSKGLICIFTNVKEFYYYKKKKKDFNSGFLFLKVETGYSCGYWTAIGIESFEWLLTKERAKTRRESLFRIPYDGDSKLTFMEEFNYLPLDKYLVTIDNVIYLITNLNGSIDSESARMLCQNLGNIQVEPLPFEWYFKVISEEGESIFSTCAGDEGYYVYFGPFHHISKVTPEQKYPTCYFGYDENGNILGMYYGKYVENKAVISNCTAKITFDSPAQKAELVEKISFNDSTIASWKLSYSDGSTKILLCSVSNDSHGYTLLDPSKYI